MKLISWNIQWARGVDNQVDVARIVRDARNMGDFDVLCLQEVAAHFPTLAGQPEGDQFAQFSSLLPGFHVASAAGVDVVGEDGIRRQFGNMILSRYPIQRIMRHQLPWPVDATVISMPRVMVEATLATPMGPLRVMNTHLEYHSGVQRDHQVQAIREAHANSCLRAVHGRANGPAGSTYDVMGQTTQAILVGDFNFRQTGALHAKVQAPFVRPGISRLVDTWQHLNGDAPHPINVGKYDRDQWPEAFTCDFIYATEDLLDRLQGFEVDGQTQSSDHQPQMLTLL